MQLTFFGGEETTDFYTGRKGAYRDLLTAVDRLLDAGIAPRIQVFVNRETVGELPMVEELICRLDLERRCEAAGIPFACFVHQGSCDGEAEKLYPIWITTEDLEKIPEYFREHTLRHFGKPDLQAVFGREEGEICRELLGDRSTEDLGKTDSPVLYIDGDFNVFPNTGVPAPQWKLGNLRTDGAGRILEALRNNESPAQRVRAEVPVSELASAFGDPESRRLFGRGDYIEYLLNRYCRQRA